MVDRLGGLYGALLAMEMRTGKTPTACAMHDPRSGALVIIGPLAAREAWREWVGKAFNWPLHCLATQSTTEDIRGLPAYFCHYGIASFHARFLHAQGIGTLVLDEIHYLQTKQSYRVQAVALLTAEARKILGLSGTLVWNKPKSLWQLLHLVAPGAWGTAFQFKCRYAGAEPGAHGWTYEGASNTAELSARIAMMTAKLKWRDVEPDLPPTTRVLEPVALTAKQYADLEAAAMKVVLARTSVGRATEAGYLATLRRKAGMLKVRPAIEAAKQAAADGHKVVLWVWHHEVFKAVLDALPKDCSWFMLSSDHSPEIRESNVHRFRACECPCFMVASMGVGGVGLDLSCSDHAIFVELDWTPSVVYQAEMRTFHKDRPHAVTYFYTDDPIESKLIEALGAKNGFAEALGLGSDDVFSKVLL